MAYQLGIDFGTTFTAAAVLRQEERAEVLSLGTRSASVASVLYFGPDGTVLVGEAAERRAVTDPERVVREFKRRIGDTTPLLVGQDAHQAHELAADLVRWVVDRVTDREGEAPELIVVTHPAGWGPHKKALLASGLADAGLADAVFLAEPHAAAVSYASAQRIEPGGTIAVYDLGGGTFDTAVLRRTDSEDFELLGRPEGIERLGGIDFDEAVFDHVRADIADALDELDPDDPVTLSAVARLRRECTEAKEALSSDTEVVIPVLLPHFRSQTRLVRAEFEAMIRPALVDTVEALRRTLRSADLTPSDLSAVLLVGGSSRIPLVTELISAELGCPVAVDTDQHASVAMGAALAGTAPLSVETRLEPPSRPVVTTTPLPPTAPVRRRPRILAGVAGLAVLGIAAAVSWPNPAPSTAPSEPQRPAPAAPEGPSERQVQVTIAHRPTQSSSATPSSRTAAPPTVRSTAPAAPSSAAPRADVPPSTTAVAPTTTTSTAPTTVSVSEPPPPPTSPTTPRRRTS